MDINQILERVDEFNSDRRYWFVRTDNGRHFPDYIKNNYIAIGWSYITLNDIKNRSDSEVKEKIAKKEGLDPSNTKQKAKITSIYNKIERFSKLKKGDIIVVPSRRSERLAFGEITDDASFEFDDATASGHTKRRHVKWLQNKSIFELDPYFFRLRINRHSISDIGSFAPYIDKEIGSLFKKDDKTHYVLSIEKQDNINFRELSGFMDNIESLLADISTEFNFKENNEEFYVKMNLQSPGKMEIIKGGKSLAVLAFLLFFTSCKHDPETIKDPKVKKFVIEHRKTLDNAGAEIDSLDINIDEIIEPFKKNGK
ncbi:hypothetical protein H3Z85_03440 [Chryseobacterium indologenes]|uniref:hypothetical protein n=1 Tax=Chryseobacterium indologenes TaxID=253 RepID=UPI0003E0684F|nr:hypothetical protein [Chryseobacterium indologenes]MBF6643082.1 hypothetical protein [Chryseobacterium indologenes]QPQ52538.1 hypothetical protein H3Z85_03440 [Chryseobacterium indologenes]QQQ73038.1 hypothetical protein JHW31_10040 [Chryseobacterium indologenes]SFJ81374.1 hypothetical protein SAMN05421692_2586 [Chryseobacterium indologenes]SUX51208.1 Uncharacterised protein [Chryseobacterium indologenes]